MKNQLSKEIKRERLARLSEIEAACRKELLEKEIAERPDCEVLFETFADGYVKGHTSDFNEVKVKSDKAMHGLFRDVVLLSHDGDICKGKFA